MTIALPKGDFLVTAGFAAITGAGVALGFTVLDSTTSTWLLILAAATLGAPVFAGSLSPSLRNVALFPISVLFGLSVAWAIGGPLFSDSHPIWGHLRPHHILWWRGICGILCRLDSEAVPSPVTGT